MKDFSTRRSNCESISQCILYVVNNGLRSASLGFPIKSYSSTVYWADFIKDWIFYLIVILIILNFINGIIVDTFN